MKIQSVTLGAVAPVVVHTAGGSLKRVHGYFRGAASAFLQIFDRKTAPTAGLAPTFPAIPVYTDAPFDKVFYDNMNNTLSNGFVLAVSSTAATYTAYAGAIDLEVDGESWWDNSGSGLAVAGDYTTGTATRDGWNTGGVHRQLLRVEFTNLTDAGATKYAKLFYCESGLILGVETPFHQIELGQTESKDCFFNMHPEGPMGGALSTTRRNGFCVYIDDVPGPLAGTYIGTDWAIKITSKLVD